MIVATDSALQMLPIFCICWISLFRVLICMCIVNHEYYYACFLSCHFFLWTNTSSGPMDEGKNFKNKLKMGFFLKYNILCI